MDGSIRDLERAADASGSPEAFLALARALWRAGRREESMAAARRYRDPLSGDWEDLRPGDVVRMFGIREDREWSRLVRDATHCTSTNPGAVFDKFPLPPFWEGIEVSRSSLQRHADVCSGIDLEGPEFTPTPLSMPHDEVVVGVPRPTNPGVQT